MSTGVVTLRWHEYTADVFCEIRGGEYRGTLTRLSCGAERVPLTEAAPATRTRFEQIAAQAFAMGRTEVSL